MELFMYEQQNHVQINKCYRCNTIRYDNKELFTSWKKVKTTPKHSCDIK